MATGTLANKRAVNRSVACRFTPDMMRKINAWAKDRNISFAEMVRRIVNHYDTGEIA
jgi:hypothetical protein